MVDGHFICLGEDGTLRLLKVNPKKLRGGVAAWSYASRRTARRPLLEYPCWAAPILSHGLLYVRGNDRLVCLELIPAEEVIRRLRRHSEPRVSERPEQPARSRARLGIRPAGPLPALVLPVTIRYEGHVSRAVCGFAFRP